MAQPPRKTAISPSTFNDYNSQLQIAVLKATKNAAALPGDITFYTSMDKSLSQEVDATSNRTLSVMNDLLNLVSENAAVERRKRPRLEGMEDVQDNFRSLVDIMDQLLERTDMRLDEHRGLLKPPAIAITPGAEASTGQKSRKTTILGRLDPSLQNASHLPKPQVQFKRKADNSNFTMWQHSLQHKYNAQVPLGHRLSDGNGDESTLASSHPYHYEITHAQYPIHMFRYAEPISPKSFEETPFTWIDTPNKLSDMLDKLREAQEIAIDLEHHSYRTFSGFVCLMQISTRNNDYVVDTLALREELEELNEVFTNPKIVKVFHGAESDIVWLQQDFNLYIVNLFDTYHASKALAFPRHGLATLLEMYCDFTPDKRYQLADWRIRPLPQEMLDYARSDTHYLLFIYDNLRNALLDRSGSRSNTPPEPSSSNSKAAAGLLLEVLARSEETSLRVYEKEVYDDGGSGPTGWDTLAKKWNRAFLMPTDAETTQRLEVYKAVHAWRDRVARLEDESTRYVLPNHYLFSLAQRPPTDLVSLHNLFPSVPPVLRVRGRELLDAIQASIKRLSSRTSQDSLEDVEENIPEAEAEAELGVVSTVDTMDINAVRYPKANIFAPLHPPKDIPATQYSALFGSAANVDRSPTLSTSRSALFGSAPSAPRSRHNRFAFRDILFRIHNDLAVAPSLPKSQERTAEEVLGDGLLGVSEANDRLPEATIAGQAEIAYVPPGKRQTLVDNGADDTIVVVGQKKRKRKPFMQGSLPLEKGILEYPPSKPITTSDSVPDVNVSEGDLVTGINTSVDDATASGSNILDDGSDHEVESAVKSKKSRKGDSGLFSYGNFKAPPKAHAQLQRGNVSRTFKS